MVGAGPVAIGAARARRDALGEQLDVVELAPLRIEERVVGLVDARVHDVEALRRVEAAHDHRIGGVHLAHALVGAADVLVAGAGIDLEHLVERLLLGALGRIGDCARSD